MKAPRIWEILLILGVIAFLAFLLFPSGGYPKSLAKRSACLSSVKRLSISTIIYAADFNDRFPNRDIWLDSISPYVKTQDKLICPTIFAERNAQLYGYAFSGKLSNAKFPPKPETVPLVFESINLAKNASGELSSLPNPGRHPHSSGERGSNNIGYADGHAKSVPIQ